MQLGEDEDDIAADSMSFARHRFRRTKVDVFLRQSRNRGQDIAFLHAL